MAPFAVEVPPHDLLDAVLNEGVILVKWEALLLGSHVVQQFGIQEEYGRYIVVNDFLREQAEGEEFEQGLTAQ